MNGDEVIGGRATLSRMWLSSGYNLLVNFWVPLKMQSVAFVNSLNIDLGEFSKGSLFLDEVFVDRYAPSKVVCRSPLSIEAHSAKPNETGSTRAVYADCSTKLEHKLFDPTSVKIARTYSCYRTVS